MAVRSVQDADALLERYRQLLQNESDLLHLGVQPDHSANPVFASSPTSVAAALSSPSPPESAAIDRDHSHRHHQLKPHQSPPPLPQIDTSPPTISSLPRPSTPPILRQARERAALFGAPSGVPPPPPPLSLLSSTPSTASPASTASLTPHARDNHHTRVSATSSVSHGSCVKSAGAAGPPSIPYLKPKPKKRQPKRKFESERLGMSISRFLETAPLTDKGNTDQHESDKSINVKSLPTPTSSASGGQLPASQQPPPDPPTPAVPQQYEPLSLTLPTSLSQAEFLAFVRRQQLKRNASDTSPPAAFIPALATAAPPPMMSPYIYDHHTRTWHGVPTLATPMSPHSSSLEIDPPSSSWSQTVSALDPFSDACPPWIHPLMGLADHSPSLEPHSQRVTLSPDRPHSPFYWTLSPDRFVLREPVLDPSPPPLTPLADLIAAQEFGGDGAAGDLDAGKSMTPKRRLERLLENEHEWVAKVFAEREDRWSLGPSEVAVDEPPGMAAPMPIPAQGKSSVQVRKMSVVIKGDAGRISGPGSAIVAADEAVPKRHSPLVHMVDEEVNEDASQGGEGTRHDVPPTPTRSPKRGSVLGLVQMETTEAESAGGMSSPGAVRRRLGSLNARVIGSPLVEVDDSPNASLNAGTGSQLHEDDTHEASESARAHAADNPVASRTMGGRGIGSVVAITRAVAMLRRRRQSILARTAAAANLAKDEPAVSRSSISTPAHPANQHSLSSSRLRANSSSSREFYGSTSSTTGFLGSDSLGSIAHPGSSGSGGKDYNMIEDTTEGGLADFAGPAGTLGALNTAESIVSQVLEWPGHIELHPLDIPPEADLYDAEGQLLDLPSYRTVEMASLLDPTLPTPDVCWDIWHLCEQQHAPRAVCLFWMAKAGRVEEAFARISAELVSAAPAPLLYLGAQLRVLFGMAEDAIRDLEDVLTKDRTLAEAWALKARLHQVLGPSRLCINGYTHVVKLRPGPTAWRAYYERGCVYEGTKEPMYAFEDFKMVRLLKPDCLDAVWRHAEYFLEKELYEDALGTIQVILDTEAENPKALYLRGIAFAHLANWGKALQDFNAAILLDPYVPDPYVFRGCLARYASPRRAIEDFSTALLLEENHIDAMLLRGHVYFNEGKYDLAHADWSRVTELQPTAHLHLNLGILAMQHLDDYILAMQHLDACVDMDPLMIPAYLARAELCQRLHLESFMVSGTIIRKLRKKKAAGASGDVNFLERATKEYSKAIRLYPSNYVLYLHRGRLLLRQKMTSLAMLDFHTAFELNSGIAQTFLQRSLILSFQGKYAQVIKEFNEHRAKGTATFEPNLLALVAKAKMRTGDPEGALAILTDATPMGRSNEPSIHIHRGVCYQSLRRYAQAIQEYTKGIALAPRMAKAYYHRGVCNMAAGAMASGLDDINEAIRLDQKMFEAYLMRASHYERQGKFADGVEDCTTAIRLEPATIRGYLYRGLLLCKLRQYQAAVADFSRVTEIDKDCIQAYLNRAITHHHAGELDAALRDYSIVLLIASVDATPTQLASAKPNSPPPSAGIEKSRPVTASGLRTQTLTDASGRAAAFLAHRFRGYLHWQRGDYPAAVEDLAVAAKGAASDVSLLELFGFALFKIHKVAKALAVFAQIVQGHPNSVVGYLARGSVYAQTGQYPAAIRDYLRCIHLHPQNVDAYVSLAYVSQRMGLHRQAWDHFSSALAMDPKCTSALQGRASIHLTRGDHFAAMIDMSAAVNLNPKDPNALVNRGVVSQAMGDHVAALRDYKAAIALDPKITIAHFNAANLYHGQHCWERALEGYDVVLQLQTDDYHALVNRALTLVRMNEFERANADLARASQVASTPAELARVAYQQASLCERQSKFAEAEQFLNITLKNMPQEVDAWIKRAEIRGLLGKMTGALQDYAHALTLDSRLEMIR
ncbi:hypothetical protein BCR44DRAFT_33344 [Catenaria anguillulae PL171]|uniref:Uncharacterized protein n=1 Tax=Catenaria anguillulae PL171 TaxID=765915 RepID=A0A1Y2HYL5_9FUNG|nr:hypothetical protein BCR44DRAFT_33344 [Catenaria anguillulae PL171]